MHMKVHSVVVLPAAPHSPSEAEETNVDHNFQAGVAAKDLAEYSATVASNEALV